MLTTAIAVVCLFRRHLYLQQWQIQVSRYNSEDPGTIDYIHAVDELKIEENRKKNDDCSWYNAITWDFVFDLIVLVIAPIPFYDKYISHSCKTGNSKVTLFLSEHLIALMLMRLYFLVRTWLTYSGYMDEFSKKVCKAYGFESGIRFAFKCKLCNSPESTALYMFFGTIAVSAYIVRIFEIPYYRISNDNFFDSFFNSIYFVLITMSTIGYGDYSPGTIPGCILMVFLAFWGALLMSVFVVSMSQMWSMTDDHELAQ